MTSQNARIHSIKRPDDRACALLGDIMAYLMSNHQILCMVISHFATLGGAFSIDGSSPCYVRVVPDSEDFSRARISCEFSFNLLFDIK